MPNLPWLIPQIQQVQNLHRQRLQNLYAGKSLDTPMVLGGPPWGRRNEALAQQRMSLLDNPQASLDEILADMQKRSALAANPDVFCPLYFELQAMGVHFMDAILGARVYLHDNQIWNDPLDIDLAALQMPDLDRSPFITKWFNLARLALDAGDHRIPVSLPGTSSPVNVAMNIFGERIFEAILAEPQAARHALRIITDTIKGLVARAIAAIPEHLRVMVVAYDRFAPPGYGQVAGCATQLLSRQQFLEFFAPLDAEILSLYPHGGMIHLCGTSAQHIPTWRNMPQLASVQLEGRANADFELYYHGLRDNQIVYLSPTPTTPLDRILQISAGRRIVLQATNGEPLLPRP